MLLSLSVVARVETAFRAAIRRFTIHGKRALRAHFAFPHPRFSPGRAPSLFFAPSRLESKTCAQMREFQSSPAAAAGPKRAQNATQKDFWAPKTRQAKMLLGGCWEIHLAEEKLAPRKNIWMTSAEQN